MRETATTDDSDKSATTEMINTSDIKLGFGSLPPTGDEQEDIHMSLIHPGSNEIVEDLVQVL